MTPDPVTDVWELLWTAACDYRDANPPPHNSTARLIDALMPIVSAYGDARQARGRAEVTAKVEALAAKFSQRVTGSWEASRLRALVAEVTR